MKKLFFCICLSLFVVSNFSEAMAAMNPEKKRPNKPTEEIEPGLEEDQKNAEEGPSDDWDFLEALQFGIEKPETFLDGLFRFEFKRLDYDKDFDNALICYDFTHKGDKCSLLFSMQKKKANVLIRWIRSNSLITNIPMGISMALRLGISVTWGHFTANNCTKKNIKTLRFFYLANFLSQYLIVKEGRKILEKKCSKCPHNIARFLPDGSTFVESRRYLSCGCMLCEECYKQWDIDEPKSGCSCPVATCHQQLYAPNDCFTAPATCGNYA